VGSHYILKRFGVAVLTIAVSSLLAFVVLRCMPGDIFQNMARDRSRTMNIPLEEAYRQVVLQYNYDPEEPILDQAARYYGGLLRGNLGVSMHNPGRTVNDYVAYALPWTLFVVCVALTLSFFLGIGLGGVMAWRRKGWISSFIMLFCTLTSSIPVFVFAFLLMIFFVFQLGWFPMSGAYDIMVDPGFNLPFFLSAAYHAVLPILTFVLVSMGNWALQMKASGISVLGEDFIFAARARGIPESIIRTRYVMRNAMLPIVTTVAIVFSGMIGNGAFVETVYIYPGMGKILAEASGRRDFSVMQGFLLIISATTILANFLVELFYSKLDPRIKSEDS
jgi:peptide/nickel transport system permease protein